MVFRLLCIAAETIRCSDQLRQFWRQYSAEYVLMEVAVRLATDTAERVCRIAFDPRSRCWYVQGTYD